jgi:hypothetical protein
MAQKNEDKKEDNPTFNIVISTEKIIAKKQTCNYKTKITAPNLESAFKLALSKAIAMHNADPELSQYSVTAVEIDK